MDNLSKKKNTLHELVKAREAIKRKYQLLKSEKDSFDRQQKDVFKPVIESFEKFTRPAPPMPLPTKTELTPTAQKLLNMLTLKTSIKIEKKVDDDGGDDDDNSDNDDDYEDDDDLEKTVTEAATDFQTADEDDDYEVSKKKVLKRKRVLDKIYGVRVKGQTTYLGNTPINISNSSITVKDHTFPTTPGLIQLLHNRSPRKHDDADRDTYKQLLGLTSAHKKGYKPDGDLRLSNSRKFIKIIKPMFPQELSLIHI